MQHITKAAFFEQYLIPAGQLAEMVAARVSIPKQADLKHALFEPLNLASAYVLNPNNDDLTQLIPAVERLSTQLLAVFDHTGADALRHVSNSLHRSRLAVAPNPGCGEFSEGIAELEKCLPAISEAIYAALGYTPKSQAQWHRDHVDRANPLTASGQIGLWRKFVRHCSWNRTLRMLRVSDSMATALSRNNSFSHEVGVMHTDALWAEVFAYLDAAPKKPKVVRVPDGVLVTSTEDGLLAVMANLDLQSVLSNEERSFLASASEGARTPELVEAMIGNNQFICQTDVTQLANAIAEVAAKRESRAKALRQVYGNWRQEADKLRKLRARLELQLLAARGMVDEVTA
jgi:hypothetical protein